MSGLYDGFAAAGIEYTGAFRGVSAVYRLGEALFAEVRLPEGTNKDAGGYGLHPALADAALHALVLHGASAQVALPFAWQGVKLHAAGADAVRVKLSAQGASAATLQLADTAGQLILEIESLHARPATAAQVRAADASDQLLYRVDWAAPSAPAQSTPPRWILLGEGGAGMLPPSAAQYDGLAQLIAALDGGEPAPEIVVVPCFSDGALDPLERARAMTQRALEVLQAWLAEERLAASRLVLVTRGAVAIEGEMADFAAAPIWGLVRAAQSENPHAELRLLDLEPAAPEPTESAWSEALTAPESQLALRAGTLRAPRLARVSRPEHAEPLELGEGSVLITGGTGMLGALVAEHLVARHGVRRLVLCSRTGRADALQARLESLGAEVTIAACDVSDRAQVQALLDAIPAAHPLSAVIHTAGVLDDGVIASQTAQRIDRVFAPKADAAFHLHELTRDRPLRAFVLFSSAAGVLGGPGQSNYAAANAFLDGLAQARRAEGLPAVSLAWGYWAQQSAMSGHLAEADLNRMARGGVQALAAAEGLELFDAALAGDAALYVPIRLDPRLFAAPAEQLPTLLRGLGRRRLRRVAASSIAASSFRARLSTLTEGDRERALLEGVLGAVSTVMAVPVAKLDPERPLSELGLDSLMAVELRNQLAALSGLRLPPTTLFDHPTPSALVKLLSQKMLGAGAVKPTDPDAGVREAIRAIPISQLREAGLLDVLLRLAKPNGNGHGHAEAASEHEDLLARVDSMSADELLDFVNEEAVREDHAG